jgi:hypothetical protein
MISARVTAGQNATVIGRGFQPGSLVRVSIDGPSELLDDGVQRAASSSCDITQALRTRATDSPGRYRVTLDGVNLTGSAISVQTEFELVGGSAEPTPASAEPTPGAATPVPPATPVAPDTPAAPPPDQPPPPPVDGSAALAFDQSLTVTGGSAVPMVGVPTEYSHVMRLTNTGVLTSGLRPDKNVPGEVLASWSVRSADDGPWLPLSVVAVLQGDTLTLRTTTEYTPGTQIVSSNANVGQTSVQGSTLVWEGRLQPGETLTLQTNVVHTPTEAGVVNDVVRAQSVVGTTARGATLVVPPPRRPVPPPPQRLVQPTPLPVDPATGSRFFPATGFSVADDNIWLYFVRRGGERTFGAPLSRLMLLNGAWVQLFERGMLQAFEDGRVVSVNLLEAPYLPYETIGDLTLPTVDEGLIAGAPDPAAGDFASRAQEFVRDNSPDQYEGLATRFYNTFLGTVLFRDAFWDGVGDPNLIPGFNLEIWGLPTSLPALRVDANGEIDPNVARLRFQRGVMVHDATSGTTTAPSLGYSLRSILLGDGSQPELEAVAGTSPLWAQYDPESPDWVRRPEELAETNLVLVFTREDD